MGNLSKVAYNIYEDFKQLIEDKELTYSLKEVCKEYKIEVITGKEITSNQIRNSKSGEYLYLIVKEDRESIKWETFAHYLVSLGNKDELEINTFNVTDTQYTIANFLGALLYLEEEKQIGKVMEVVESGDKEGLIELSTKLGVNPAYLINFYKDMVKKG